MEGMYAWLELQNAKFVKSVIFAPILKK